MSETKGYKTLKQILQMSSRPECRYADFISELVGLLVKSGLCRSAVIHLNQPNSNFAARYALADSESALLNNEKTDRILNLLYDNPCVTSIHEDGQDFTLVPVKTAYMVYGSFILFHENDKLDSSALEFFESSAGFFALYLERLYLEPSKKTIERDLIYDDNFIRVIDAIPEPLFFKGLDSRYKFCNKAFLNFVKKEKLEVIGKKSIDVLPGTQFEFHTGIDAKIVRTGKSQEYECDFESSNGDIRHILIRKNFLKGSDGDVVGFVGVIRDITDLKKIEEQYEDKNQALMKINSALLSTQKEIMQVNKKLSENEEKYRLLVENQREFVVKLDITGQFIYSSSSFDKFVNNKSPDTEGKTFQDYLIGADKVRFQSMLRDAAVTGSETEIEMRMHVGGVFHWISWSFKSIKSSARELDFIIGVGRDVTLRRKTEIELENYRSLLEAAFAQSPNPLILIKYPDKKIMIMNEAAQRFFELAQDSYKDRMIEDIDFPDQVYVAGEKVDIINMLTSEKIYYDSFSNTELHVKHSSGHNFFALLYSTPIYNQIGELISYLMIFPEITDLKEAEKRIEEQNREIQKIQKLESIGVLAGGIAHDFNNILGAVMGNLSLARFYGGDEKITALLSKAETAIGRAKELTNQLLTFSKGGAPVRKTASLNEIVRESALFSIHGSKAVIEFRLDQNLKPGLIDSGQISQVIQNLVMNASESMTDGGVITVSTINVEICGDDLPLEPGEYVKVTVSDHGNGISPEIADRVFDPFFSTKNDGNGLGLTTSFNIIKKHSGYIGFNSREKGTDFFIYLPVSTEVVPEIHASYEKRDKYDGKILLMDDDPEIRDVGRNLLKLIGFEVNTVNDGKELLSIVNSSKDAGIKYDLYVMDLTILGGMGGEETIGELLKIDPDARVIVSSGYANNEVLSEYRKYGFCGVLEKPYTITDVKKVLKEINYA